VDRTALFINRDYLHFVHALLHLLWRMHNEMEGNDKQKGYCGNTTNRTTNHPGNESSIIAF
jgi:hypothetical protein